MKKLSPRTEEVYTSCWQRYRLWAVENGCSDELPLDASVVERFAADLLKTRTPGTARTYLSAIAHEHRRRDCEPKAGRAWNMAREPHEKTPPIAEDVYAQLLDTCDSTPRGLRDRAIFLVYGNDRRRRYCEVVSMDVEHLEDDGSRAVWAIAGTEKKVVLNGNAYTALKAWIITAKITSGPVFVRLDNRRPDDRQRLRPGALRNVIRSRRLQLEERR